MSSEREIQIRALKEKLEKELYARANNEIFDDDRFSDAHLAIVHVGKKKIYSLKDLVHKFLKSESEILRAEAVRTLGSSLRLHLPEFKDKSFAIWESDPSEEVKANALDAWTTYHMDTKDPKVIGYLYKVLKNEEYDTSIRYYAIAGIYFNTQEDSSFFDSLDSANLTGTRDHETFNSRINWEEVESIVKKYAPDALK